MPNDICKILVSEDLKSIIDNAKGDLSYTVFIAQMIYEKDSE